MRLGFVTVRIQPHAHELCRGGRSIRALDNVSTLTGARGPAVRGQSLLVALEQSMSVATPAQSSVIHGTRAVAESCCPTPRSSGRVSAWWYAINGFGMHAPSRAPLNATLAAKTHRDIS